MNKKVWLLWPFGHYGHLAFYSRGILEKITGKKFGRRAAMFNWIINFSVMHGYFPCFWWISSLFSLLFLNFNFLRAICNFLRNFYSKWDRSSAFCSFYWFILLEHCHFLQWLLEINYLKSIVYLAYLWPFLIPDLQTSHFINNNDGDKNKNKITLDVVKPGIVILSRFDARFLLFYTFFISLFGYFVPLPAPPTPTNSTNNKTTTPTSIIRAQHHHKNNYLHNHFHHHQFEFLMILPLVTLPLSLFKIILLIFYLVNSERALQCLK